VLDTVLGKLARQHDPNVLVGFDHADDAGVYLLGSDTALVQTVDFFTPIVDDPYTFGQIAATNALSDVYAMGGKPITALAMVCFPDKEDTAILEQILAGGLSKMVEANCTIIGGHSIRDEEIKFGYAVTGLVNPRRVLANGGAKQGDRLLFTKSLGTGVIATAIKKGTADPSWIAAAVKSMTTLNKTAAEIIVGSSTASNTPTWGQAPSPAQASKAQSSVAPSGFAVRSLTDVTGFGLIGHAREMALASHVSLRFFASRIPVMDGALECIRAGNIPGGLKANRDFAECLVSYDEAVGADTKTLLFDPQTAGGLLISVAATDSHALQAALRNAGVPAVEIGEVLPAGKPLISIGA
jgi:selenide, water dikinase